MSTVSSKLKFNYINHDQLDYMDDYKKYHNIAGEQCTWICYTAIHGIKVLLLAIFYYNTFANFQGEIAILRAIAITLASSNMFGWFFICHALLSKNIYQMKVFNLILSLEFLLLTTLLLGELGNIEYLGVFTTLLIPALTGLEIIYNVLVIKSAEPEFSWYYFKKTRMAPHLLGKLIF